MNLKYALEVKNIDKQFHGVQVLKDISFSLEPGKIVGIVGQNGAGKSTLMKILAGVYQRDSGSIQIDGVEVMYHTPIEALNNGVATIHQELSLCPNLTIAENVFLGDLTDSHLGLLKLNVLFQKTEAIFNDMGINLNPRMLVRDIPISQQQIVEIAKAYRRKPKILILDEPTSALNIQEKKSLYKIMNHLKTRNTSMVFISHYLDEVLELCDEIVVLRDGKVISCRSNESIQINDLVTDMVDENMSSFYPDVSGRTKYREEEKVLQVRSLKVENTHRKIGPVSLNVRKGEIIGMAGFEGAGHNEIARALAGLVPYEGEIELSGKKQSIKNPKDAMIKGISYVPSDRKHEGLVLIQNSYANTAIPILNKLSDWLGRITNQKIKSTTVPFLNQMNIAGSLDRQVLNLSGGNQQKVVLAKLTNELIDPELIILHEPTRGVDVRAKSEIYNLIVKLAEMGTAIILVTTDLEEVVAMSDRVIVFRDGQCIKEDGKFTSKAELQFFIESEAEAVANL